MLDFSKSIKIVNAHKDFGANSTKDSYFPANASSSLLLSALRLLYSLPIYSYRYPYSCRSYYSYYSLYSIPTLLYPTLLYYSTPTPV